MILCWLFHGTSKINWSCKSIKATQSKTELILSRKMHSWNISSVTKRASGYRCAIAELVMTLKPLIIYNQKARVTFVGHSESNTLKWFIRRNAVCQLKRHLSLYRYTYNNYIGSELFNVIHSWTASFKSPLVWKMRLNVSTEYNK